MKKSDSKAKGKFVKRNARSAFAGLPADRPGFKDRLKLSSHKWRANWDGRLKIAWSNWKKGGHDTVIKEPHGNASCLHPDEIEAAIQWECFRHLFLSGKLSEFWNEMIIGDRFRATERFKGSLSSQNLVIGGGVSGFGAPWAAWADDPSFPSLAWVEARQNPQFSFGLHVAPKPNMHAVLLRDELDSWAAIYSHAKQNLSGLMRAAEAGREELEAEVLRRSVNPLEMPLTSLPKKKGAENITRIVVEIDWNSTDEEIKKCLHEEIKPIWEARNPTKKAGKKKTGRRDGALLFFAGLVIRRRMNRGLDGPDAIEGLYEALEDRKSGMSRAAKRALAMADDRLRQTEVELAAIENKMSLEAAEF